MWLCSLVQLLTPALIDDEPCSLMSTSGRTALPPPPGGLICPCHMGLYRTGPPPPHRGGLSRPPTRRVGLGCTCPPSRRWAGSHLPSFSSSYWVGLHLPSSSSSRWVGLHSPSPLLVVAVGWVVTGLLFSSSRWVGTQAPSSSSFHWVA